MIRYIRIIIKPKIVDPKINKSTKKLPITKDEIKYLHKMSIQLSKKTS